MAFTPYYGQITVTPDGGEVIVQWFPTYPPGTWYQVYLDGARVKSTTSTAVHLPMPGARSYYQVGKIGSQAEANVDYSASLPPLPKDSAKLSWYGGKSLTPDIAAFRIYSGDEPGAPVDYSRPVATVPAFSGNKTADGFGRGGFGRGGFGSVAQYYEWESDPLEAGTWDFTIRTLDIYGHESTNTDVVAVNIAAPPEPVPRDSRQIRLHKTYDAATGLAVLHWQASPSAS